MLPLHLKVFLIPLLYLVFPSFQPHLVLPTEASNIVITIITFYKKKLTFKPLKADLNDFIRIGNFISFCLLYSFRTVFTLSFVKSSVVRRMSNKICCWSESRVLIDFQIFVFLRFILLPLLITSSLKFAGFTHKKLNFGDVKSLINVNRFEDHFKMFRIWSVLRSRFVLQKINTYGKL